MRSLPCDLTPAQAHKDIAILEKGLSGIFKVKQTKTTLGCALVMTPNQPTGKYILKRLDVHAEQGPVNRAPFPQGLEIQSQ